MGMTRLAATMSLANKKAMFAISSKSCCYINNYQNNRVVGAFFTSGSGKDSSAAEEGGGVTGFVADKAREGTKTAVETVVKMGDTAKKIADDAWGRTKETAHKIRESVVGEGSAVGGGDAWGKTKETAHKVKETVVGGEGHRGGTAEPKTRMPTDSSTEDVRKRSGGYD